MTPEMWIALMGIGGTVVAAILAVTGTVVSTVVANRSTRERESDQWQRQLREQRRQERLEVCEQFATEAWLMAHRQSPSDDLTRALNRLHLRTSDETAEAANRLFQACWKLAQQLTVAPMDFSARDERLKEVHRQREKFLEIARREE
jgi:hypothetical protein